MTDRPGMSTPLSEYREAAATALMDRVYGEPGYYDGHVIGWRVMEGRDGGEVVALRVRYEVDGGRQYRATLWARPHDERDPDRGHRMLGLAGLLRKDIPGEVLTLRDWAEWMTAHNIEHPARVQVYEYQNREGDSVRGVALVAKTR